MKRILLIAWNDLRLFLKEKGGYFWLFGSPLLFAFFMGFANRGPGAPSSPRPILLVEDRDGGFMAAALKKELGSEGLTLVTNAGDGAKERVLRIPEHFTESILSKKPVKLALAHSQDSAGDVVSLVELRLFRALVSLNAHLLEHAAEQTTLTAESFRSVSERTNPVSLHATFGTRRPIPAGFNQSLPGILVMFTMMNLLIFGGATLAGERRDGVLKRLLANPVSRSELILGKISGLMLLGVLQFGFLLLMGTLLMKLDFSGSLPLVILVLVVYAWVAAALGILAGSLLQREEQIIATCVLASMVMAALGGCWWPLEIVPDHIRTAGHIFPSAWAMDSLHQLLSFGGGFPQIALPLAVLAGFALAATAGAIRWFRV